MRHFLIFLAGLFIGVAAATLIARKHFDGKMHEFKRGLST